MMVSHTTQSGFALLMTLVVVGVVLAIGLSVLDLSIKQVRLTATGRDSELAFQAANAGLECARFNRLSNAAQMEVGAPVTANCFSETDNSSAGSLPYTGDGDVFLYDWEFTWGETGSQRCSRMNVLIASTTLTGVGVEVEETDMLATFPGFTGGDYVCEPSARCTVISVQGFNRPCNNVGLSGTVQREVLLQF